jgi:L-ascorbate metabolism protein UlaG (beta-lactamase superfamily)
MKVTKYPQSCLLLEKDGQRIVIDPGSFFSAKFSLDELGDIKAVLFTHQHKDHLDPDLLEELLAKKICLYGNADVSTKIGHGACQIESGAGFTVAGFAIMPHDLPHFTTQTMQDPPQNTGYIIDGTFFHPGDSVKNDDVRIRDLAAPIAGGFTFDNTIEFARSLEARRLLPIHYSNHDMFPVDPEVFVDKAKDEFEVVLLDDGQAAEF